MSDHTLCRAFLTASRLTAKKSGTRTDKGLGVLDNADRGSHRYFVVEDEHGKVVWEGSACCRYDARSNAILRGTP